MKTPLAGKIRFALAAFAAALPLSLASADSLKQASITEAVNSVSYQTNAGAPQKEAAKGTVIHSDNVVRTGVKSRAELTFNDKTVARMGANSAFTFDGNSQKMNLEQGSMLFCKPKNAGEFEISTPAATCAISGTTGFAEVHGKSFVFGLVEGSTSIVINGVSYNLNGGDMLVLSPDGKVSVAAFDVVAFVQKAGLLKQFKSNLPNQKEIDEAVAEYIELVKRGFIQPTDGQYLFPDFDIDPKDRDRVAQILQFQQNFNKPGPTKQDDCCWEGGYGGGGAIVTLNRTRN